MCIVVVLAFLSNLILSLQLEALRPLAMISTQPETKIPRLRPKDFSLKILKICIFLLGLKKGPQPKVGSSYKDTGAYFLGLIYCILLKVPKCLISWKRLSSTNTPQEFVYHPKKKRIIFPTPSFFRGELLKFRGLFTKLSFS